MTATSANALHHRKYVIYLLGMISAGFAVQILSVSLGWQIYAMTRNPLHLGYAGLAQFLPAFLLVLVTGLVADKYNRRLIMVLCFLLEIACAGALLMLTIWGNADVRPIFAVLFLFGVARAFMNPAADALAPNLLPREAIPHGISLSSMQWQFTSIVGPVAGGLLYGVSPFVAYGASITLLVAGAALVFAIGRVPQPNHAEETNLHTLLAGIKFIRSEPVVLGAISLDLFAVLLGGAVALMPIYASDILVVGPVGAWPAEIRARYRRCRRGPVACQIFHTAKSRRHPVQLRGSLWPRNSRVRHIAQRAAFDCGTGAHRRLRHGERLCA